MGLGLCELLDRCCGKGPFAFKARPKPCSNPAVFIIFQKQLGSSAGQVIFYQQLHKSEQSAQLLLPLLATQKRTSKVRLGERTET